MTKFHLPEKVFLLLLLSLLSLTAMGEDICYTVNRIWGNGKLHCAFTSLVKYRGAYYCAFREGYSHVFNAQGEADGKVRIIRSTDGTQWQTAAIFALDGYDLRDPKLSVMPSGRIMLSMARSLYKSQKFISTQSLVSFSDDGVHFTDPQTVNIEPKDNNGVNWLWRTTWHKDKGYVINYYRLKDRKESFIELLTTTDGINYKLMQKFYITGDPNESTIRFADNDKMLIFIRRESGNRSLTTLTALPPYTDWTQHEIGFFCGGPDAIVLGHNDIVLGGRSTYIPQQQKAVLWVGDETGNFGERIVLPSARDCGYPSFLVVGDELWLTYYSNHETRNPCIYLAKIPLRLLK